MKSWKGSCLYSDFSFAVWLLVYGEENAVITVRANGTMMETYSLFPKWRCGLCDREFELPDRTLLPHVNARTGKAVCGECIESLVYERFEQNFVDRLLSKA